MIVYNTLIAIAAGVALIGYALFLKKVWQKALIDSEGWAAFFGVNGLILAVLGFATCVTWPYGQGFEYASIAFGEPAAAFGALSLFTAVYLWRNRTLFEGSATKMLDHVTRALKPISIFVFVSGLMMLALALAWVRFQNGAAPKEEPISGLFHEWPLVEALFLGGLWAIVAVGCLAFPLALKKTARAAQNVVIVTWLIGGIVFSLFGAMNFYTHTGMYTNINKGTEYRI